MGCCELPTSPERRLRANLSQSPRGLSAAAPPTPLPPLLGPARRWRRFAARPRESCGCGGVHRSSAMFPTVRQSPIFHSCCSLAELLLLVGAAHSARSVRVVPCLILHGCAPAPGAKKLPRWTQVWVWAVPLEEAVQSRDPAPGAVGTIGRLLLLPQCVPAPVATVPRSCSSYRWCSTGDQSLAPCIGPFMLSARGCSQPAQFPCCTP